QRAEIFGDRRGAEHRGAAGRLGRGSHGSRAARLAAAAAGQPGLRPLALRRLEGPRRWPGHRARAPAAPDRALLSGRGTEERRPPWAWPSSSTWSAATAARWRWRAPRARARPSPRRSRWRTRRPLRGPAPCPRPYRCNRTVTELSRTDINRSATSPRRIARQAA